MEEASCYELCKTPLSFLGVTPSTSQGEHGQRVLITSVTDGVQLFHTEKRECIRSWSGSLGESFTSPCVLHNGRLFAVQNEKILCSWDPSGYLSSPPPQLHSSSSRSSSSSSTSALFPVSSSSGLSTTTTLSSSVKHRAFPHPIAKLHAHPNNPGEVILILGNGTVVTVSANSDPSLPTPLQLLESLGTSNIPKGRGRLIASCIAHNKERTFVAYLRIPADAGSKDVKTECFMNIYSIHTSQQGARKVEEVGQYGFRAPRWEDCDNAPGLNPGTQRTVSTDDGKVVTPLAFDWQLPSRTVGLVWSNGLFQALKFETSKTQMESLVNPPQQVYVRPLSNFNAATVSLAFVGMNFVGVTGQTLSGESQFLVLETLYGTQSVSPITLPSTPALTSSLSTGSPKKRKLKSSSSSALEPSVSSSSTSSIVVSSDGMYCFCTHSSVWVLRLPSILPAQAASLAVAVGQLKDPILAQPPVAGRLDLLRALLQVDENSNLFQTMDSAIKSCDQDDHELLKILDSGDTSAIDKTFRRFLIGKINAPPKTGNVLSHNMIIKLATRTLALQCWPTFQLLLQSQLFSARTLPNVVSVLIEHKQTQCLEVCVANVHDLSEDQLVQALQYGLEHNPPLVSLVDAVLAARHSDSFLHDALKVLPKPTFGCLLDHLVKWLNTYWEAPQAANLAVSLSQVINWCSILLDSNVVDFLLPSSQRHQQLQALQQAVRQHLGLAHALTQPADVLKALCASIEAKRAGNKVEPQPALADYSIELLLL